VPYIPFWNGSWLLQFVDEWFEVVCYYNDSSGSPKPFLRSLNLELLNISLGEDAYSRSTVSVNYQTFSICTTDGSSRLENNANLAESPFLVSHYENIFIAMGCNKFSLIKSSDTVANLQWLWHLLLPNHNSFGS
jgi:hypothetical protein